MGDDGISMAGAFGDSSIDEAELEYLRWRVEKVGVTGEGISDADELFV